MDLSICITKPWKWLTSHPETLNLETGRDRRFNLLLLSPFRALPRSGGGLLFWTGINKDAGL